MITSVGSATVQRLDIINHTYPITEFAEVTPRNWKTAIQKFLCNDSYSAELRAGIGFLAINAAYPTKGEFNPLRDLLALGQGSEAWSRINRAPYSRESRRTHFVPSGPNLVDITRYSAERAISGIPRVVRNFIVSSSGRRLERIVWSGGRVGRVAVEPTTGGVVFPRAEWKRGNRRARWVSTVVSALRDLAGSNPRLAFAIFTIAQWLPVPAAVLYVRHPEPRVGIFLHNTTIVVPEVMGRDVADRLTTWQRVGLGVQTRFIVHDLLPLSHSEFFSEMSSHEYLLNLEAFTGAERVFTATPLLEQELDRFSKAMGRSTPSTNVLPLPVQLVAGSKTEIPQPSDPYVVFMGGYERRKRLATFVDYVLGHRAADDRFSVVIVGRPPILTGRYELDLLKRIVHNRHVFRTMSGLTDEQLRRLMAGAIATVYVSEAEGYGLPVLESLAVGTPVITAPTKLNHHLNSLYGGVIANFDDSPDAINEIRRLSRRAHRKSVASAISREAIPHDIDAWAATITDGLGPAVTGLSPKT